MKAIEISKNSWHYKMAKKFGDLSDYEVEAGYIDSCKYRQIVMTSVLLCLLVCLSVTFITACVSDFLTWIVFMIVNQTYVEVGLLGGLVIFVFIAGIILSAFGLLIYVFTDGKDKFVETEMYKSWKEKFCAPVTFAKE